MTYAEWFNTQCGRWGVDEQTIQLIMVNQGINPNDTITDPRIAKKALVAEFATMIPLANISEGGYSVSYNWEAIKMWYRMTCAELGIEDKVTAPKPAIRDRSNIW